MDSVAELKEAVSLGSRIVANEGLVQGFGQVSIRIPGTDRFLIPPSIGPSLVRPIDVLTIDLSGNRVEGERPPQGETWIHTCIFRVRSDVGCVVHTHPPMATVLASAGIELKPLHNFGAVFPDGVPLFTKPGLIINEEIGTEMAAALGNNNALLLRGHGAVVVGADVMDACLCSIYLEEAAIVQYHATLLGKLPFYTREEAAKIRAQVHSLQPARRAWEYYVGRLPKT